jgi:mRNA-degrading endonuclease RelE of RelBE toxin-antitoxin system
MAYDISFQRGIEAAFENLDSEAASWVQGKLEDVATNDWRSPTEWDYTNWTGQASGKYNWGPYRIFVDIDQEAREIVVYEARHRENLYR